LACARAGGRFTVILPFIAAFPDMHHAVPDVLVDGVRGAARISVHGTHQGEFMGGPATGNAIAIGAINIFQYAGDQIVEHWVNSDTIGLLQQIGAFPMPGQGGF
jgi:predicted ester cyclase